MPCGNKNKDQNYLDLSDPQAVERAGLRRVTAYTAISKKYQSQNAKDKEQQRKRDEKKGIRQMGITCSDLDRAAILAWAALSKTGARVPHPDSISPASSRTQRLWRIATIFVGTATIIGWVFQWLAG